MAVMVHEMGGRVTPLDVPLDMSLTELKRLVLEQLRDSEEERW